MYLCTFKLSTLFISFIVLFFHLPLVSVSSMFVSFNPCIHLFERGSSFVPLFIQKILEGPEKNEKKDSRKELPFSGRIQFLVSEVF